MGKQAVKKATSSFVIICMLLGCILLSNTSVFYAESMQNETIQAMDYFSENDGPNFYGSGVGQASYGFVMPIFNHGNVSWQGIASDLQVNVKKNGNWTNIESDERFVYNYNWGHWNDGGFSGYWFIVSETTEIRLSSIANPDVTLDYILHFTNLSSQNITSMTATQGPEIIAGLTGGSGFTYPVFNGDASITYEQIAHDLNVFVWSNRQNEWVDINNNPSSGWIYDQNFGNFYDGGGGLWFTVEETTYVRLASKSSPDALIDYKIIFNEPIRTDHRVSADVTLYTAGETGAIGVPLPMIDGGFPIGKEIDNFVYELNVDGVFVPLADFSQSGFTYQANGYHTLSDKNQWGYWVDYIYGLWFQPIQVDMEVRIGYPVTGIQGDPIEDNYVYYTFIGNPDAPRPPVDDLVIPTPDNPYIEGWSLIWGDEFEGNSLDLSKWSYDPGYYIDDDPDIWGWGNAELEYYTESENNIFVENGYLNLKAMYDPTTFPEIDPDRVAEYSSGKVTTKGNFSFQYGRIDFRAKLPVGTGLWPALWMLPSEDVYGPWASSGEIDVMEARGRLPGMSTGAIHYGGRWPSNQHIGGDYSFKNGETIDSDFHVYSVVWEEDTIKWYVDGACFLKVTNDQWHTNGALDNPLAPFDQEFYIIMNLAVGGNFDGLLTPSPEDIPALMQVDYVRVYYED